MPGIRALSSLGTLAAAGAQRVELARQSAALARGGVLVNRVLGGHLIQALRRLAQLRLGLLHITGGHGGVEALDLFLDQFLAIAIARTPLEVLADTLLGGNRMGHCEISCRFRK